MPSKKKRNDTQRSRNDTQRSAESEPKAKVSAPAKRNYGNAGGIDGTKLSSIRAEKGLTQEGLSEVTGVSVKTIQNIESNKTRPLPSTIKLIVQGLKISAQELSSNDSELSVKEALDARVPLIRSSLLPVQQSHLYSRDSELEVLTECFNSDSTACCYLEGIGGVGKTGVVVHWLSNLVDKRASWFEYSFNGQEYLDRTACAANFFNAAFNHFHLGDPSSYTNQAKAELIVGAVSKQGCSIVLDGLEVLQNPPGTPREGYLTDPGIRALIRLLVDNRCCNYSLLILTTQTRISDLRDRETTSVHRSVLSGLDRDGIQSILNEYKVTGRMNEVVGSIQRQSHGHPLTVHLLGGYIEECYGGDGRRWYEAERLTEDPRKGIDALWVMQRYEKWLANSPTKLGLLKILSLLDGAVTFDHLLVVVNELAKASQFKQFKNFGTQSLRREMSQLQRSHLCYLSDHGHETLVDTHAILRDYFRSGFKKRSPAFWKETNARIFKIYANLMMEEHDDDLNRVQLVQRAIHYGCRAGRQKEALKHYRDSVHQSTGTGSIRSTGRFGEDLMALHAFIDQPTGKVAPSLSKMDQVFVTEQIGTRLRWVGRLKECIEVMGNANQLRDTLKHKPIDKSVAFRYRAECLLLRGSIKKAVQESRLAVQAAETASASIDLVAAYTILGNSLRFHGKNDEAALAFEQAEKVEKLVGNNSKAILPSVRGFRFHELLLALNRYDEIIKRCDYLLKYGVKSDEPMNQLGPVNEGVTLLALASAYSRRMTNSKVLSPINIDETFDNSIEFLNSSGRLEYVYIAYLRRAQYFFAIGKLDSCRKDLSFCFEEALHDEMFCIAVEAKLLKCKLHIWDDERSAAKKLIEECKSEIEQMQIYSLSENLQEVTRAYAAMG